jgi:uncharacterized membrane protein YdbT with pleckstrin-like domain
MEEAPKRPTEQTVWQANPSWRGMLGWYVKAFGVVLLVAVIAWALKKTGVVPGSLAGGIVVLALGVWVGLGYLIRHSTVYTVTNQAVSEKSGILSIERQRARLDQITNTTINRSLTERMLGVGRLNIDTAAEASGREDILQWWGIADPFAVEQRINELRPD